MEKVLLLHGPIISCGINFLSAQINRTPEERKKVWAEYSSKENIRSLSIIFRKYGYKILYSAWNEDKDWILNNSELFDGFCFSDQSIYPEETLFQSKLIQNNKEKLFYSCQAGIKLAKSKFGEECIVVRMRSDICIDIEAIELEVLKINHNNDSILIEYAHPNNTYFVPDFILISSLPVQQMIYDHLVELNSQGISYHISSHIDLGATFLFLQEQNKLKQIMCMSQRVHNTMVWRGIPRYYEFNYNKSHEALFFDCIAIYPKYFSLQDLISSIPTELSGRFQKK